MLVPGIDMRPLLNWTQAQVNFLLLIIRPG